MAHRIEVEHAKYTRSGSKRRQMWRVWFRGEVLIPECRYPLGDAARVLLARGVTGKIEMCHRPAENGLCQGHYPAPTTVCMRGDIEKIAGTTINDGDRQITVRKFVDVAEVAVSVRKKAEEGVGGSPAGAERRSGFLARLGTRLGAFQGRGDTPSRR